MTDAASISTADAIAVAALTCAYCGASHQGEAAELARKAIVEEEARRLGASEARARADLEAETARIRREHEAQAQELRNSLAAAQAASEAAAAERIAAAEQAATSQVQAAERAAREAREAAEAAAAEAAARIEAAARDAAKAAREAAVREAEEMLNARTAELAARASAAESELSAAKDQLAARLREAENRFAAERAQAVLNEQIKASEKTLRLQSELAALQRKLEEKSNQVLGEEGEADILGSLREAFPDDEIIHVGAGNSGADVVQVIRVQGEVAGRIVYDAKNRKAWRSAYLDKLREDAARHQADHAVLASLAFPSGARQLHVENNVIIASPARVVAIATLLRRQILETHRLRLSGENRAEKAQALYGFITSEQCQDLMDRMSDATGDIEKLDAEERRYHERIWKRRENILATAKSAHGDLNLHIARLIGLSNGPEIAE